MCAPSMCVIILVTVFISLLGYLAMSMAALVARSTAPLFVLFNPVLIWVVHPLGGFMQGQLDSACLSQFPVASAARLACAVRSV